MFDMIMFHKPQPENQKTSGGVFYMNPPLCRIIYPVVTVFDIAMENDPFIDDFPMKTSIYSGFSMAMLVITRW